MMKLHHMAAAALAASLLAACGDTFNADLPPGEVTEIPASATASTTAYTQFTAALVVTETGTPLGVNSATPPTSESDTPITF